MKNICLLILTASVWILSTSHAEVPTSKYGADDTLGAINNLSPEKVLQATRLVKHGKTYRLGVTT
ncbi:MAG: cyclase family protein, partial [Pseudomonadales bacterium]